MNPETGSAWRDITNIGVQVPQMLDKDTIGANDNLTKLVLTMQVPGRYEFIGYYPAAT